MNNGLFKKSLIVIGAVALFPTLYFLVKLIVDLSTTTYLPPVWTTLNWVAICLYGLSLLMLVAVLVYGAVLEQKSLKAEITKEQDEVALKKYQSKN